MTLKQVNKGIRIADLAATGVLLAVYSRKLRKEPSLWNILPLARIGLWAVELGHTAIVQAKTPVEEL